MNFSQSPGRKLGEGATAGAEHERRKEVRGSKEERGRAGQVDVPALCGET